MFYWIVLNGTGVDYCAQSAGDSHCISYAAILASVWDTLPQCIHDYVTQKKVHFPTKWLE